jgi:hypothetical protein
MARRDLAHRRDPRRCRFVVSGTFLTQGFTWPVYILLALSVAVARRVAGATAAGA